MRQAQLLPAPAAVGPVEADDEEVHGDAPVHGWPVRSRAQASTRPIRTRRLCLPLLSHFRIRIGREASVVPRWVTPQAWRSSATISTLRIRRTRFGGGATAFERIRPGSAPTPSTGTVSTQKQR